MTSPVLSYYGAKWRATPHYPAPTEGLIVEPFAGSAGYSVRHGQGRAVLLIDKDPRIVAIWEFLIGASADDVRALPLLDLDATAQDLPADIPDGARELIRGWLQGASRNGKNSFSSMAKAAFAANPNTPSFWGAACRERIASQVAGFKGWGVILGSYSDAPDEPASWFVDPPYDNTAGETYRFGRKGIDYAHLAQWCRSRDGQVIVCENMGATWLPFRPLYGTAHSWTGKTSRKAVEGVWP